MEIPKQIKKIAKLPDSFDKELESIIERKEVKRGELLFEEGTICHNVYFIEKGLARIYYYSNSGKEITAWFFQENSFFSAIDSFCNHAPTRDFCEVLEDSVIYIIKYSELENLLNKEHGARMALYVLLELMKKTTEFIASIKFQSAEDRYNTMIKEYPSIFQRVKLGYIASYLGIAQETLSRIRAGK
jgi:CRP-like cAMP-binding protein